LTVVDEVTKAFLDDGASAEWHTDWFARYSEVDNRLELLGSATVRIASYAVYNATLEITTGVRDPSVREGPPDDYQSEFDAAYKDARDTFEQARAEMLDAMRDDVTDEQATRLLPAIPTRRGRRSRRHEERDEPIEVRTSPRPPRQL
jgi:hypothetical protein